MKSIPEPAVKRLCLLYRFFEGLEKDEISEITSSRIGSYLGFTPDTVRKDLSYLGKVEGGANGYSVKGLSRRIRSVLGFDVTRRACIVGLGPLGEAFLKNPAFALEGYLLVAGFDSDVNRIERTAAEVPLYPAYEIPDRVRDHGIELAVLTVPGTAAQKAADRLVQGGIRGIVSYSAAVLDVPPGVTLRSAYLFEEFRILSAYFKLGTQQLEPMK